MLCYASPKKGLASETRAKLPRVNHRQAMRALEKAGFRIVRPSKHSVMSDGDAHSDQAAQRS